MSWRKSFLLSLILGSIIVVEAHDESTSEVFLKEIVEEDEPLYEDEEFSHGSIVEDPYVLPRGSTPPVIDSPPIQDPCENNSRDCHELSQIEDFEISSNEEECSSQDVEEEAYLSQEVDCCVRSLVCRPLLTPYFFVEGGLERFYQLPTFSYGLEFTGTGFIPSTYMVARNDQPYSTYFQVGLGSYLPSWWVPYWFGVKTTCEVKGFYASSSLFTPIQGNKPVSFLPFITGGNGLVTGAFPAGGDILRSYNYGGVDFSLTTSYPGSFCGHYLSTNGFFDFSINRFQQIYGIDLFDSDTGQIATVLNESLSTTYYDLGVGTRVNYPLPWDLLFFIEGGGYLSFADTNLSAHQQLAAGGGFIFLSRHDDHSLCSSKFKGSLGLRTRCGHLNLSFIGRYEYWGYVPKARNLSVTATLPPVLTAPAVGISNSFLSTYSIGLRAWMEF